MNLLKRMWDSAKSLLTVAAPTIIAREPSLAAGATAIVISVATHYGLSLNATQQTFVTGGALFLLNFIVRQVVTPTSVTALKSLDDVQSEAVTVKTAQRRVSRGVVANKPTAKKATTRSRRT